MHRMKTMRAALLGGGMYGGDVLLRTLADLARCGLAPYLGSAGLDVFARALSGVDVALAAVGTRSRASAEHTAARYADLAGAAAPAAFWGETPWDDMLSREIDILFVATPDDLHAAPALAALAAGVHVVVEKPLCLRLEQADAILAAARAGGCIAGVDMHKRYDPCHRFLFRELAPRLGALEYGRAVLEEPIEVSSRTFAWAARSNPFSYVGVHWVDLFEHYLDLKPSSLHAVGQKRLLASWPEGAIDTFDAMQVTVHYDTGLSVQYVNNWIMPAEFEGAVNQEMELTGTRGKIEFDQQDRGLRAAIQGHGSRTYNPHFTHDVARPGGPGPAFAGYGKDSLVACAAAAALVHTGACRADELEGAYPSAGEARQSVGVIEAAAAVAERNLRHTGAGRGAPVTAFFSARGIELRDPLDGTAVLYEGNPFHRR